MTFEEAWRRLELIVYTGYGQPDAVLDGEMGNTSLENGWANSTSGSRLDGYIRLEWQWRLLEDASGARSRFPALFRRREQGSLAACTVHSTCSSSGADSARAAGLLELPH